ncbi:MAG: type VI secretion system baseplate subunit TssF [Planctomycetota bacterium]
MDDRLLDRYESNLASLERDGGELAQRFPDTAGRLDASSVPCADPYVEQILDGLAYLNARVGVKLDAQRDSFAQGLLGVFDPLSTCPAPSVCVVQINPDLSRPMPPEGVVAPRGSVLESLTAPEAPTPCRFLTTREIRIQPIALDECTYFASPPRGLELPGVDAARAAVRLVFRAQSGTNLGSLVRAGLASLPLFARGVGSSGYQLLETIDQHLIGAWMLAPGSEPIALPKPVTPGFAPHHALLPDGGEVPEDRRLLREHFICRDASAFVELRGLDAGSGSDAEEFDVVLLLDTAEEELAPAIDRTTLKLFCTPAVNVFPKRAARAPADGRSSRFPVIPDRGKPLDFEVYRVTRVTAHANNPLRGTDYKRFYSGGNGRYFTTSRRPRPLSNIERRHGRRTGYPGGDAYVSLTDAGKGPIPESITEVAFETLCTNRHLVLAMPKGRMHTDFEHELGRSIGAVRVIAGPTDPHAAPAEQGAAEILVRAISQAQAELDVPDPQQAAEVLRNLLRLSSHAGSKQHASWIEAIRVVRIKHGTTRINRRGAVVSAKGREFDVEIDPEPFEKGGAWLFGTTLERALAARSAINRYSRLTISTRREGTILRWPARLSPTEVL